MFERVASRPVTVTTWCGYVFSCVSISGLLKWFVEELILIAVHVVKIRLLMVYLPPPHLETPNRPGYERAYNDIVATHRRSPLSSASSLIMLVAPDVDAVCASRMLADLLKQDDIMHRIVPVSGMDELERIRDELVQNSELCTLIMINMGAILDLPSPEWFGEFPDHLRVHIIDSNRPQNLASLFGPDEKIVLWDDGGAENLEQQKKAWLALAYAPDEESEDEDSADSDVEDEADLDEGDEGSSNGKRRRRSPESRRKRRRVDDVRAQAPLLL